MSRTSVQLDSIGLKLTPHPCLIYSPRQYTKYGTVTTIYRLAPLDLLLFLL
ncbi:unnamed protein product [Brassica oleracea var. botrytis]